MENGVLLFYFTALVIKDSSLLFFMLLSHQNIPDHSGVRHCLYNQDIKYQVADNGHH